MKLRGAGRGTERCGAVQCGAVRYCAILAMLRVCGKERHAPPAEDQTVAWHRPCATQSLLLRSAHSAQLCWLTSLRLGGLKSRHSAAETTSERKERLQIDCESDGLVAMGGGKEEILHGILAHERRAADDGGWFGENGRVELTDRLGKEKRQRWHGTHSIKSSQSKVSRVGRSVSQSVSQSGCQPTPRAWSASWPASSADASASAADAAAILLCLGFGSDTTPATILLAKDSKSMSRTLAGLRAL